MQLSIVMPAHNEAAHIEQGVTEWHRAVLSQMPDSELIVVDDASTDGTGSRLEAVASRIPQLRVLRLTQNVGHGPAVRRGLDESRGEFVFQTDSDRQHSPDDFWALWKEREHADFVFGVRKTRADGQVRAAVSATMRLVNFVLFGRWIADANCPFKLMRREALDEVLASVPRTAFIPMVMVSVLARRLDFRVREVPVDHFPRTAGQQSLAGVLKWLSVGRRCAGELLALRLHGGSPRAAQPGRHRVEPSPRKLE